MRRVLWKCVSTNCLVSQPELRGGFPHITSLRYGKLWLGVEKCLELICKVSNITFQYKILVKPMKRVMLMEEICLGQRTYQELYSRITIGDILMEVEPICRFHISSPAYIFQCITTVLLSACLAFSTSLKMWRMMRPKWVELLNPNTTTQMSVIFGIFDMGGTPPILSLAIISFSCWPVTSWVFPFLCHMQISYHIISHHIISYHTNKIHMYIYVDDLGGMPAIASIALPWLVESTMVLRSPDLGR